MPAWPASAHQALSVRHTRAKSSWLRASGAGLRAALRARGDRGYRRLLGTGRGCRCAHPHEDDRTQRSAEDDDASGDERGVQAVGVRTARDLCELWLTMGDPAARRADRLSERSVAGRGERGTNTVFEHCAEAGDSDRDAAQAAGVVEARSHPGALRVNRAKRRSRKDWVGEADADSGDDE